MHRLHRTATGLTLVALCVLASSLAKQAGAQSEDPALTRTRIQVKMLDDLYKSAVISITSNYVDKQSKTPAAAVAKDVFKFMKDKGWHSARLVDATGRPIRKANLPATDFEKKAIAVIKRGIPYFEEVADVDGKRVLRVATVVPAVMQQCVDCHPHVKMGDVLGMISYEVPIK